MWKKIAAVAAALVLLAGSFTGGYFTHQAVQAGGESTEDLWEISYDTSVPSLQAKDGWYQVLNEEFTATQAFPEGDTKLNPAIWATSPEGVRGDHYWCNQMVEVKDGTVVIHSRREDNHNCPLCKDKDGNAAKSGIFSGGIETRKVVQDANGSNTDQQLFSQAFGYFEAKVKVPSAPGMWSAFWIQGTKMNQLGNAGRDGSEIDIYESSFRNNPKRAGSCIHYDGYGSTYHRSKGNTADTGTDLYDGEFHVYGLKWTPWEYVFYVDGKAVWATDFGGISDVPEFLRLTVELKESGWGPYGQRIGKFKNKDDGSTDFVIDYVKVYQNKNYEAHIRSDADYAAKAEEPKS